jgi:hypothetical protein
MFATRTQRVLRCFDGAKAVVRAQCGSAKTFWYPQQRGLETQRADAYPTLSEMGSMLDTPNVDHDPNAANSRRPNPDFLAGGGEVGARLRALNWQAHPLGESESWPQSLCTTTTTASPECCGS